MRNDKDRSPRPPSAPLHADANANANANIKHKSGTRSRTRSRSHHHPKHKKHERGKKNERRKNAIEENPKIAQRSRGTNDKQRERMMGVGGINEVNRRNRARKEGRGNGTMIVTTTKRMKRNEGEGIDIDEQRTELNRKPHSPSTYQPPRFEPNQFLQVNPLDPSMRTNKFFFPIPKYTSVPSRLIIPISQFP
jgi:hypothetical protein